MSLKEYKYADDVGIIYDRSIRLTLSQLYQSKKIMKSHFCIKPHCSLLEIVLRLG